MNTKITFVLLFFVIIPANVFGAASVTDNTDADNPAISLEGKVSKIKIEESTIDDLIKVFGEPEKYLWGSKVFDKKDLPATYIAVYPKGFSIVMSDKTVSELRFEAPSEFTFMEGLKIGSSLNEAVKIMGRPKKMVNGKANDFEKDVLYRDIDGKNGLCYYNSNETGVRCFFTDNKVVALYITSTCNLTSDNTGNPEISLEEKVSKIKIEESDIDDIIKVFGEPEKYLWGQKVFDKKDLPATYIAVYPKGFSILMSDNTVGELRFSAPSEFTFMEELKIGSNLSEAIKVMGRPEKMVRGEANTYKKGILYRDIEGKKGRCYYESNDKPVRCFFTDNKVTHIYTTSD